MARSFPAGERVDGLRWRGRAPEPGAADHRVDRDQVLLHRVVKDELEGRQPHTQRGVGQRLTGPLGATRPSSSRDELLDPAPRDLGDREGSEGRHQVREEKAPVCLERALAPGIQAGVPLQPPLGYGRECEATRRS
jgi:hypothetical protein